MSGWLALAALVWLCQRWGRAVLRRVELPPSRPLVWGVEGVAGLLLLHGLLTLLDLLTVSWTLLSVGVPGLALLALSFWPGATQAPATEPLSRPGWGMALALASVAGVFYVTVVKLWSTNPDFIYHWGLKGQRYWSLGGIDYDFLTRPWNWYAHPDYPNLLPELFATTALAAGAFEERLMLVWTPLTLLVMLATASWALRRVAVDGVVAQAGVAGLGVVLAMVTVGRQLAGGPDLWIALALLLAMPALLLTGERPRGDDELLLSLAVALAACSKIEGVPLAALLWAAYQLRAVSSSEGWRGALLRGLRTAAPAALLVLPWLVRVYLLDLFGQTNTGAFDLGNAAIVFAGVWKALGHPDWHGFGYLLLALVPLVLVRCSRWLVLVCLGQLALYLWVYFKAQAQVDFYVASSFPRLMMHLWPATWLAVVLALDRWGSEVQE